MENQPLKSTDFWSPSSSVHMCSLWVVFETHGKCLVIFVCWKEPGRTYQTLWLFDWTFVLWIFILWALTFWEAVDFPPTKSEELLAEGSTATKQRSCFEAVLAYALLQNGVPLGSLSNHRNRGAIFRDRI